MAHDLFLAAKAAMAKCYAPYSKFPVGAAIRTTALSHFVMGGGGEIKEVAVIAERMRKVTPCGGCRQRLAEFAGPETKVYLCDETGVVETVTMGDLLPFGFRGDILK
jgi:cytidine deaminase